MFHNVSKIVLCGRRNTFATFPKKKALHVSWQAQHSWDLQCHFAWQVQHFPCVVLRIFCESRCQGCVQWWHSTLNTPHFTLSTPHTPHFTLYTPHFTLYTSHFTLHTLHLTLYTPHFTLYTPHSHCTLHTLHFPLHTWHFTLHTLHFPLHTWYSTLYTLHSTLYTFYSTFYTLHFTLCIPFLFSHNYASGFVIICVSIRVRGLHLVWLSGSRDVSIHNEANQSMPS